MKFETLLEQFNSELWGFHIKVPAGIARKFTTDKNRRVLCTLNQQLTYPCALMPDGQGGFFITVNKENRKKLNLRLGDTLQAELKKDTSKYGMPVPEELGELLKQDDEGNQIFQSLLPGKQRNLLYLIGKYKHSDTRLTKAIIVINYLKSSGGKLDFKELNEAFRENGRL